MRKDSAIRKALRQRPRMSVGPNFEEKITMKEARRRHGVYMEAHYISRAFLIQTKTLSAAKLTAYEKKGMLNSVKDGGAIRYKREDILRVLADESAAKGKMPHRESNSAVGDSVI